MWAKDEALGTQLDYSQLPNEVQRNLLLQSCCKPYLNCPGQVAEHVLSYLGMVDLYAAALVCHKWSNIIAALPAWTGAPLL